jgi:dTDP-4-amino-4,6-dideoxygalactose transaminase
VRRNTAQAGAGSPIPPEPVPLRVRPEQPISVGGGLIGPRARAYVNDALDTGRLTYGRYTRAFEREFARLHGTRFAIFCNSGTSALQVALHALKRRDGWHDGDEVLVPAITFVASVNVIIQNGLTPVFVDVDPDHYDLDPSRIEEKITPRTRAIMPVHVFGQPCDMAPIMDLARHYRLRVVEDSCEAMFVRYRGAPVGSFGDISCFSTYMAHLVTTGVGGIAATNDPELATMVKSLFNHGRDSIYLSIDDDDDAETPAELFEVVSRRFNFVDVGYSYRATELEAAIGLAQLEGWQEMIAARQANATALSRSLMTWGDRLQLPRVRAGSEHAFMVYPVVLKDVTIDRDELILFLEENQIETRYMLPLLNQPIYRKLFGDLEAAHPVARHINRQGFYIGCHPGIGPEQIAYVAATFDAFFRARR